MDGWRQLRAGLCHPGYQAMLTPSLESSFSLCCLVSVLTGPQLNLITLVFPERIWPSSPRLVTRFLLPSPLLWAQQANPTSVLFLQTPSQPASRRTRSIPRFLFSGPLRIRVLGAAYRVTVLCHGQPDPSTLPVPPPVTLRGSWQPILQGLRTSGRNSGSQIELHRTGQMPQMRQCSQKRDLRKNKPEGPVYGPFM